MLCMSVCPSCEFVFEYWQLIAWKTLFMCVICRMEHKICNLYFVLFCNGQHYCLQLFSSSRCYLKTYRNEPRASDEDPVAMML